MKLSWIVLVAALAVSCRSDLTTPTVPLSVNVSAHSVDGAALPAWIEERPGAGAHLTEYHLSLTSDGTWTADGYRYPDNTAPTTLLELTDNGTYEFDGASLTLHSNLTHTNWASTVRGDTITAAVWFPIANASHVVVLWP